MKRIFLSIILLLSAHQLAFAKQEPWVEELKAAQAALAAKDYRTAYDLYRSKADRNPLAQFVIGLFHHNGWDRAPDPRTACSWFEKAAAKSIPAAEHYWGDCLAEGIGRAPDVPAAIAWYGKAASHGHLISQCSVADHYIQGKGVPKDVKRGVELCTQIAQANSPPAMLKLARYYREGKDVPQDLAAARHWYQQAAERRSAEAQYQLGLMLAQGEGGEPDLDSALFWLETAAGNGHVPAYLPTAVLYANAPVQQATGALAPEHLAKIYLWAAAAKARSGTPEQLTAAEKLEAQVLAVMPETWRADLDKKVAEHLARYPL
ncbi:MAG TPA: sel1 repeat family protein [Paucimonas sp.]|nr:sel1 repeat family protein [Paucimonas sp.]